MFSGKFIRNVDGGKINEDLLFCKEIRGTRKDKEFLTAM
jgi:hypothetical protein